MQNRMRRYRARLYYLKRPILQFLPLLLLLLLVVANLTIRAESELIGTRICDLSMAHHIFVVSLGRDGTQTLFPSGDTVFAVGDSATVQTEPETLKRLHKLNADPEPY